MKKIKVLHLIKSLGRGGAEMLLPETLGLHQKNEFEFHVIYFLPWKNQMVNAIEQAGGMVSCFEAGNNLKIILQAKRVAAYVKQNGINVIHCHLPWAGFAGRIIYRLTGVPVLYTEHNKQERYHFLTKLINRYSFNSQAAAVAVSAEVADSVNRHIHPRIPVYTILNGVNTNRFQRNRKAGIELRRANNINDDELLIGTVAVFRFQKRLELWLEVFAELKKKYPACKAVLVGDGPFKEAILQKRKELGLEEDVLLPGLQINTVEWLSAMDIYMMSSVFEGLPVALLEAMSCSLPVVCTNAGGTGEVVRNNIDGLLVPVDEPYSLAELLEQLVKDFDLRQRLGAAARKRTEEAFAMERMVHELELLYRKVIAA